MDELFTCAGFIFSAHIGCIEAIEVDDGEVADACVGVDGFGIGAVHFAIDFDVFAVVCAPDTFDGGCFGFLVIFDGHASSPIAVVDDIDGIIDICIGKFRGTADEDIAFCGLECEERLSEIDECFQCVEDGIGDAVSVFLGELP